MVNLYASIKSHYYYNKKTINDFGWVNPVNLRLIYDALAQYGELIMWKQTLNYRDNSFL